MRLLSLAALAALPALALSPFTPSASAAEYYVGEPVVRDHMQIVPNYLTGIIMSNMPHEVPGKDEVHLEADVHATKAEPHGFAEDAWIPYLTIHYTLTKKGTDWKAAGQLLPMTAGDGPHYANNLKMDGPGTYHLTYVIASPETNGFLHHVDKATGVPGWWQPITVDWTFTYPSKAK